MSKYTYSTKSVPVSLIPSWVQLKNTYDLDDTGILLLNHKQVQAVIAHDLLYSKDHLWGDKDTKEYLVKMFPNSDCYLNQSKADNHLFLSSASNTDVYKTRFTEKEYKELQSKYSQWLPKYDTNDPHFVEVQDDKNSEPITKLHDSELMYPDEEFTRNY